MKKSQLLACLALTIVVHTAYADEALARKSACVACHTLDKKLLGPSFKQVAEKYKGQADAQATVEDKIRKGGSGGWGAIAMPAQPQLKNEDIRALAAWILGL